jgi:RNA polymerase sigma-70 factor (ECF subfamily)
MNLDDRVKLAIKGDEESFEYLINTFKENLYRTAYSYVKNEEDALDVLQETIYKAYISIEKLKEPKYFKTWITRILINNALDVIKKEKRIIEIEKVVKKDANYHENQKLEERLDIINYVDKLEDKYKNVIILKYFQDLTIVEISEVLEYPVGTVKTHLNAALKKLRVFMSKEGA